MILSGKEILRAMQAGKIAIEPFEKKNVGAVSVDLRLGNYFRPLKASREAIRLNNNTHYPAALEKEVFVPDGKHFLIKARQMVLGVTREKITLAPGVAGWLQGRSTIARLGLSVHVSSALVQPGSSNVQVLEIVNNSPSSFILVPGIRVCQIVFEQVKGKDTYSGVFRTQTHP